MFANIYSTVVTHIYRILLIVIIWVDIKNVVAGPSGTQSTWSKNNSGVSDS